MHSIHYKYMPCSFLICHLQDQYNECVECDQLVYSLNRLTVALSCTCSNILQIRQKQVLLYLVQNFGEGII
jgi:hypothetical protein